MIHVIPTLERLGQKDQGFKVSLSYTETLSPKSDRLHLAWLLCGAHIRLPFKYSTFKFSKINYLGTQGCKVTVHENKNPQ